MKIIIDQRLNVQERTGTVLMRDSEIWTYGINTKKLLRYTGVRNKGLTLMAPLPPISVEDVALTWNGSHLLVANRTTRKVFQVEPISGQETLVMDPTAIAFGNYDTALLVVDTIIGDIAWHDDLLYLALQAGYSSAIYGIDLGLKRVVSHRLAPGPKPCGLDFDPVDGSICTIDGRNRELRRLSTNGKEDAAELPSEWVEPRGLSFDSERGLWSSDFFTGDVLRFRLED